MFALAARRLRSISAAMISREAGTGSFDASDLLQEAYLQKAERLAPGLPVRDSEHFFSLMARGMRQILIDRSRFRQAQKRRAPEDWDPETWTVSRPNPRTAELAQLRERLAKLDPQAYRILCYKTDFGLRWEEIARRTGLSVWQCRAEYNHALHWLRKQMA